jgi:hypothetical protein
MWGRVFSLYQHKGQFDSVFKVMDNDSTTGAHILEKIEIVCVFSLIAREWMHQFARG